MKKIPDINEYIDALKNAPRMKEQVVHHTLLPPREAEYGQLGSPDPEKIMALLEKLSVEGLYRHQAEALDHLRARRHVVAATPTASGKSLIYNLSALERIMADPGAKALYLFPLKALAQDQLVGFRRMAGESGVPAEAEIYDGDTADAHRKRIRKRPPNVILTNPDMLHLSFLPYHKGWASFYANLQMVVVDEVHTYRGIMGAHMAQVFRRFIRICGHYGAHPVFVFCSATVANPAQLAQQLTGLHAETVAQSGAPVGKRHLVLMDSVSGPVQTAIQLLKAALHRKLRTIVYTQSRKLAELIALWAGSGSGRFKEKISAYRAGFLPEERREIEALLSNGELLAVISTSALELGIDIGDLDLCILVGYPGTVVATWQRAGRVGRSGQDAAMILVSGEDALDQYFMRHPQELLTRPPESAVVNPENDLILEKHLVCAAAEWPLRREEPILSSLSAKRAADRLLERGELLQSGDGREIYSRRKMPHRDVDLRGTGSRYGIICKDNGERLGEIDGFRAFRETHPGAVYLHCGRTYRVAHLDIEGKSAMVEAGELDYYTRVRSRKETEIIEIDGQHPVRGTRIYSGRLRVTDQVVGYERIKIRGGKRLGIHPLELPPQVYETEGIWFIIPPEIQQAAEKNYIHFMGGIHAIEHAAIGIFPLLVMADRNDLGGISTPMHPQIRTAAVFIYDGIPGGAGLTRQAFFGAEELLLSTRKAIKDCPCNTGCPSCVHSPKCGSGNRPIDKEAALFLLDRMLLKAEAPSVAQPVLGFEESPQREPAAAETPPPDIRYGVLDIETQRSADEVGGWHRADQMGVSCAVLYDSESDTYTAYSHDEIDALMRHLQSLDLVVGFNIRRFDYLVLSGCIDFDFSTLPTLDLLEEVKKRLGFRLSLDQLAKVTLNAEKSADGLQALRWWKEGRIEEIIRYCTEDVRITRELFLYGRKHGHLLFNNRAGKRVRVPARW